MAVLINKAMIEIPPKFTGRPPVNPEARKQKTMPHTEWRGAQGLADDVRYYGQWMRDEAEKRIGHLYPKVEVTAEMANERQDLKPLVGRKLTVIAWLWARTVKSPNPAFAHVDVPLASTFMLSTKPGKEAYVRPAVGAGGYQFRVAVGKPNDAEAATNGTKLARGNFRCLLSGAPISSDYIRGEGQSGRMSVRMMAIVAESDRGRVYLRPTPEMEEVAGRAKPKWRPDVEFFQQALGFRVGNYGMTKWSDLFTDRQLVTLTTLSDLVPEAREQVNRDASEAGLASDTRGLSAMGAGAPAYADAVATYLALIVSKESLFLSTQARWRAGEGKSAPGFGRQAIPMVWDYADVNLFAGAGGDLEGIVEGAAKVLGDSPATSPSESRNEDATNQRFSFDRLSQPIPRTATTSPTLISPTSSTFGCVRR